MVDISGTSRGPGSNAHETAPNSLATQPELVIYGHSPLIYWWPVWLAGYIIAAVTYLEPATVELADVRNTGPSSWPGVIFCLVLLTVVFFTTMKFRGIRSVALVFGVLFIVVLFAWLGWWDAILTSLPRLSVHMSLGFYLLLSTALLALWLGMFLLFDRLVYWRIRPGQLIEVNRIGSSERTFDSQNVRFEQYAEDVFRHRLLGLGAGDLIVRVRDGNEEIRIPNVMQVDRKVRAAQALLAVKPESAV